MDPWRNTALQNVKTQSIAAERSISRAQSSPIEDMPAPPAYHMVVDHAPLPGLHGAYNSELEADKDEEDEIPEIAINAATQIRGNGNIISIAQMDSARIATLLANILNDIKAPETASPASQPGQTLPSISSLSDHVKKSFPKVNITVNCGATVIGDRNIVGPGLGDIARQMQLAQRNQALQALQAQQQQQQQQQRCQGQARTGASTLPQRETLYQAQASIAQNHGLHPAMNPTPPMSRSSSLQSEGTSGTKRKAEDSSVDGDAKRHC